MNVAFLRASSYFATEESMNRPLGKAAATAMSRVFWVVGSEVHDNDMRFINYAILRLIDIPVFSESLPKCEEEFKASPQTERLSNDEALGQIGQCSHVLFAIRCSCNLFRHQLYKKLCRNRLQLL